MDWADILTGAAATAGGGIFGMLGALTGGVFKYFKAKQEQKFQREKWDHEDTLHKQNIEMVGLKHDNEVSIVAQSGSWKALEASVSKLKAAGESYRWVNALKDLYRPFLATLLLVVVYLIFRDLLHGTALAGVFSPAERKELLKYIVYSVTFSGATSWTWYFADRAFAPPGLKNR